VCVDPANVGSPTTAVDPACHLNVCFGAAANQRLNGYGRIPAALVLWLCVGWRRKFKLTHYRPIDALDECDGAGIREPHPQNASRHACNGGRGYGAALGSV
jgi:hypothetical protein